MGRCGSMESEMKATKQQIHFAESQLAIAAKLTTPELIETRIKTAITALRSALEALK